MFLDYQYKVILLFYFSCLHNIIDSQFTESPDQLLVACSGSTVNLRWNYITTDMLTLQWFSESTEMMSQIQANPPSYSNNYNQSIVEFVADAEISLKTLTAAFTGSYSCKVNYLSGNEYSNGTYLTVYDTFTSGLSCQYDGNAITCTQPDASVSLNATDEQGSEIIMNNPTKSGNYTICMQGDAIVCRGVFPTCTTVEVIIQGPTSKTSTLLTTERTISLSNTFDLSHVTAPTRDISASMSVYNYNATIPLHANTETNEAQAETSDLVYEAVSSNHITYATSPTFYISFIADPSSVKRETALSASSSNYFLSYDELSSPSAYETNHFLSQSFFEATFFLPLSMNSTTVLFTPDFISHSPIINDTSKYSFPSMKISSSHVFNPYMSNFSNLSSTQISTTGILDIMFEISNLSSFSSFSLKTEISKIPLTASNVFFGTEYSMMRTTFDFDEDSFSLNKNVPSFSQESFVSSTEKNVSNELSSSRLENMENPILITATCIDTNISTDDLMTTFRTSQQEYASSVSMSSEECPQPKDHIFPLQTSEYYATVQTELSSYLTNLNKETAGLEIYSLEKSTSEKYNIHTSTRLFQTQIGLIQDPTTDFKPYSQLTGIVYASELSEYILKDLQSTSLLSPFNIKAYTTGIESNLRLTNMLTVETQPSRPTINPSLTEDDSYMSAALSEFATLLLTTKINFTNEISPSMITPSFQITNSGNSYVGINTSIMDSVISSSNSFKLEDTEINSLSSGLFKSISTLSSYTIENGLSEKTKNIIFISTSSALVTIIVVILLIIVFARTYLSNENLKPVKKNDAISWSNTNYSLKIPTPDYVFTGKNIHLLLNTSSTTFKTYPYENNWEEIV